MLLDETPCSLRRPEDDEVHVWTVFVPEARPHLPALAQLLAPEEAGRAARFHRPADRTRYIVAHGVLRQLLGRYLSAAPATVKFVTNAFGKPALPDGAAISPLSFNLAHSADVILCAFAGGRRVGVDVEFIRTDLELAALTQGQFSPGEIAAWQALPVSARTGAFFRCWTRKEAYVKARGEGLGFPLQKFSVAFGGDEPPALQWVGDDPAEPAKWSMFDLAPAAAYAGALVAEGRSLRLVRRTWRFPA